jgi:D-alanyl-D-alanine carboxypeptidase (penicillin-binding protein 5/6)
VAPVTGRGARAQLAASAAALLAALLVLLLPASAPAATVAPARAPSIGAPSAIVIDANTGERLYGRAPNARRSIASTTKLMTALITLARTRQRDVFTAPAYPGGAGESTIGLRSGERMSVHDLLRALMLPSANDAAYDLAVNVGGSRARFVRQMNVQARALGLTGTHYSTPIGLDDPGNYSTATDLAKLAARLLRNPTFAKIVNLPSARLRTGSHPRTVINRNDLVARYPFVDGVKTGHTNSAGYVLVGAAHGNGARVVSVVLGPPSIPARDADSLALLRWGVAQFRRVRPVARGRTFGRAKVKYHDGSTVRLVAQRSFSLTARRGRPVRTRVDAPTELEGPIAAGERVGTVQVRYRNRVVGVVPLVTATPVEGASFVRKATSGIGGPVVALALLALLGAAALLALRVRSLRRAPGGRAFNDHHRHAQRRDRQDARGSEFPPGPAPPRGRADRDGRRQRRERRSGA